MENKKSSRILMILEISQKQAYIFASRKLQENIRRSGDIAYVTSEKFFIDELGSTYQPENMVYTGGGHTVLQFPNKESAQVFARAVSRRILGDYPGMLLFLCIHPYNDNKTPGENLNDLARKLEEKKSRREAAFFTRRFGFELEPENRSNRKTQPEVKIPDGWKLTTNLQELNTNGSEENFLAVVHIDGNSMGKRVQSIYDSCKDAGWDKCVEKLFEFSEAIDAQFREAVDETVSQLAQVLEKRGMQPGTLPIRKIIGAGDDICLIMAGDIALDYAASLLENLEKKTNPVDEMKYTACAGIVLIHEKYPFRKAYDLSEALCSNAKVFAANMGGDISAMDWHIEFGQMKDSLTEIRNDYTADDGSLLNLRPVALSQKVPPERSYAFFRTISAALTEGKALPRSKVKTLRPAMRRGLVGSKLAILRMEISTGLSQILRGEYLQTALEDLSGEYTIPALGLTIDLADSGFYLDRTEEKVRARSIYYDAIEIMDHCDLWKGAE